MPLAPDDRSPAAPLLDVAGLTVRFGGITALHDLSFQVGKGQICGLIGPNGAGKTTAFNCLSRVYHPAAGQVWFGGGDLLQVAPYDIVAAGLSRTFQHVGLFSSLNVLDNILVGGFRQTRAGFARSFLRLDTAREERSLREAASEWIARLGLRGYLDRAVGDLPFGLQKRVELARAMMSRPTLLLLDEPAAGLVHEEAADLARVLRQSRTETGMSILLIEHHMGFVMGLCDNLVVLDFGRKIAEGRPETVSRDPSVIEAYLGRGRA